MTDCTIIEHCENYASRLNEALLELDYKPVVKLANELAACLETGRQVFVCGNGGSGANAIHIANDFLYPLTKTYGKGVNIQALTANSAVLTCLGNDEGYDEIFSYQLAVQAKPDDVLIVLSGSGNSRNILRALEAAKERGMKSYAMLGFDGGIAKNMADTSIHAPVNDMQISEDIQMIIANMVLQWLHKQLEISEDTTKTPQSRLAS